MKAEPVLGLRMVGPEGQVVQVIDLGEGEAALSFRNAEGKAMGFRLGDWATAALTDMLNQFAADRFRRDTDLAS